MDMIRLQLCNHHFSKESWKSMCLASTYFLSVSSSISFMLWNIHETVPVITDAVKAALN